ncbi:hypothetical protein H6G54_29205 [Anabaena cylindrica FACHB-243]|jgi:hypothetical protein|uniref:Uncharacterized protein n=1 Tax=Anabaena cylindrica (strain ATCC 27899 / PCC 7122) TaxID=272123 RepID=K9ZRS3_ANACC|nr:MULTISPECIES: hypothetical protein [Anabaena]AFZ61207.1 hypothetical protein Anacy_5920 [Anabaena cylindrica PCC 7122]MBD2421683.1 hypothetical protein [Anabaena cylindrica FACHB-243]MBY5280418.1 hypothetical protein [Anabaena sp. CCAP 1446/1C]MBY5308149.1 hypothetical protein [Anabaena sp. CCAP 1446/1C]MCM2405414.1 hypothetical protein [Anabaena sp. CCAP 1446/1C]
MTKLSMLQAQFIKEDVYIRLNNLNAHLTQIQSLSQDFTNNEAVKNLIRETMYFIEWIAPDLEFDYAFDLANLGRFLTRWLFSAEAWNNTDVRNQINQELGDWNNRILQMSQLLAA